MSKTYELHPLCTLFPRMSGFEFECLKLDIKENGLRTTITLHDGMILDGGNRYKACIDLGINPIFDDFIGNDISQFVLTSNLHRRHLTPGQQAAIVACVQDWSKAQPHGGDRKLDQGATLHLETSKDRSEQSGASLRTQKTADKVAKANPELAKAVSRGEITLPQAEKKAFPKTVMEYVEPEPEYSELDAAHDQIDELQSQLAVCLSHGTPEEQGAAKDFINGLHDEIKLLNVMVKSLTTARDMLQIENNDMKKQMERQRNEIKKLKGA